MPGRKRGKEKKAEWAAQHKAKYDQLVADGTIKKRRVDVRNEKRDNA